MSLRICTAVDAGMSFEGGVVHEPGQGIVVTDWAAGEVRRRMEKHGAVVRISSAGDWTTAPRPEAFRAGQTVLSWRGLAYGDQLVWGGLLAILRRRYPQVRIVHYCHPVVAAALWQDVDGLPFEVATDPIPFAAWRQADWHLIGEGLNEDDWEPDQPDIWTGHLRAAGLDPELVPWSERRALVPITAADRAAAIRLIGALPRTPPRDRGPSDSPMKGTPADTESVGMASDSASPARPSAPENLAATGPMPARSPSPAISAALGATRERVPSPKIPDATGPMSARSPAPEISAAPGATQERAPSPEISAASAPMAERSPSPEFPAAGEPVPQGMPSPEILADRPAAGDGGADAAGSAGPASVPAVARLHEGSGETRRPGGVRGSAPLILWQLAASTPIRSYPPQPTRAALRRLVAAGCRVLVLGTDRQVAEYGPLPAGVERLDAPLRVLFAAVGMADGVVCPDSVFGWAAQGLGIPCVSLWGSFLPSDRVGAGCSHRPLVGSAPCVPCRKHEKPWLSPGCPAHGGGYCRAIAAIPPQAIVEQVLASARRP